MYWCIFWEEQYFISHRKGWRCKNWSWSSSLPLLPPSIFFAEHAHSVVHSWWTVGKKGESHWGPMILFLMAVVFNFMKAFTFLFSNYLLGWGCYSAGVSHGLVIGGWGASFLQSCWIIQVRRDVEWLVVQSCAQSKASCEVRHRLCQGWVKVSGCSRLYPFWSWRSLSFLQNRGCPASLGQLLSCWTVLIMKMFLLISSLNVPDLNSCLLSLVLLLCTAEEPVSTVWMTSLWSLQADIFPPNKASPA